MDRILTSDFLPLGVTGFEYNFSLNSMARYLIIITLIYYFIKGLIYLLLWQTTYKIEENARARKKKEKEKRDAYRSIWQDDDDDEVQNDKWW